LDDYGANRPNFSYPIHTLYLDSDGLQTYKHSLNGTKNRFKLRLRYYNDEPESPVFFEVKSRVDNCILKRRCPVHRSAVPLLLAGHLPEPEHLLSKEFRHLETLNHFSRLMQNLNARPKAHNHYMREAWVTPDNNAVRVTFDRNILIEPHFTPDATTAMTRPTRVFPEFVVLELKFTERFPNWFNLLVQRFNLMQYSSAKYSEGIMLMGESKFHQRFRAGEWNESSASREDFTLPSSQGGERPRWRESVSLPPPLEHAAMSQA
jgi:hypothetical protein